jgi:hypothetical protein
MAAARRRVAGGVSIADAQRRVGIAVVTRSDSQSNVVVGSQRALLVRHLRDPAPDVRSIEVTIGRDRGDLRLAYVLEGNCAALRVPPASASVHRDGLWRHTCFEAFFAAGEGAAYREFNFSPSGEWAAYAFSARRTGMAAVALAHAPRIQVQAGAGALRVTATIAVADVATGAGLLRVGLSAVIEDAAGRLSYFALAHPAPRPDFHDPAGFTLRLPME